VTQKYIKKFVANLASHVWLPFVYCNVFNRQGHLKYWYLTSLHHTSCVPSWRQNEGKHCRTRWCIRMGPGWNLDKMIRDLIWSDLWYPRFLQSSDHTSSVYLICNSFIIRKILCNEIWRHQWDTHTITTSYKWWKHCRLSKHLSWIDLWEFQISNCFMCY